MKINENDLNSIRESKLNALLAKSNAEKSALESHLVHAQYQNKMLSLYVKYNLSEKCSINEDTGEVLFPEPESVQAEEHQVETGKESE